jgi:cysteine desulfurase
LIYLDHQATTPVDPRVLEAMLPWFQAKVGNPHSTTHAYGRAAHAAVEQARGQVARLINAEPDEVVFTSGATEATNIALRGFLRTAKAHAVTTAIEHSCVRETFADLQRRGLKLSIVGVSREGLVDPVQFAGALSGRTRLASVMAANNEVGTIQPLDEIASICRDAGVVLHTDAAQAAGKIALDVRRTRIGLMSMSGHKLYGPQGVGVLYCRRDLAARMQPLMTGGDQEGGLRPGTLPTALCVGMGMACDIARRDMEADAARLDQLRIRFIRRMTSEVDGIGVNGSVEHRLSGNINLLVAGVDAEALLSRLPDVAMSTGSACSSSAIEPSHVLLAMGLSDEEAESSIRIGLGRGTTEKEVDEACRRLAKEIAAVRATAPGRAAAPRREGRAVAR